MSLATLIALAFAAMVLVSLWRQVLFLVLSLLIAVFCLGLIYIAENLHH